MSAISEPRTFTARQMMYLLFEVIKLVRPQAIGNYHELFTSHLENQRIYDPADYNDPPPAIAEADQPYDRQFQTIKDGWATSQSWFNVGDIQSDYGLLSLTLKDGEPSGRFIPVIIEALFHDFSSRPDQDLKTRNKFCQETLVELIADYFPEADLTGPGLQRLMAICRELKVEAADVDPAQPRSLSSVTTRSHFKTSNLGPERKGRRPAGAGIVRPFKDGLRNPTKGSAASKGLETTSKGLGPLIESANPIWREIMAQTEKAARSRAPILLTGESGTGKEVMARYIHRSSPRAFGPFVAVNCGAVPENLLESELFGYRQGAFTGAREDKPGLAAQAHQGTLFLDEIGWLPLPLQVKLLRFLQEHAFLPLGDVVPFEVDVRVIAATNLDLDEARGRGAFRHDLYFRLNVFRFVLPPLRMRREDLLPLAEHFIDRYNQENNTQVQGLSVEVKAALLNYSWPGNVRELENIIQRAVILAGEGMIGREHLPPEIDGPTVQDCSGPKIDDQTLTAALTQALTRPPGARDRNRRLAKTVPLSRLIEFFHSTAGQPFPPRALADFITPPDQAGRRDKLTHQILSSLTQAGLLDRGPGRAQAVRYHLKSDFFKPR